jgi:voltage-gated potassium channel Kch
MSAFVSIVSLLILYIVLQDAFETIVLPRRVTRRIRLARIYYVASWNLWSFIARKIHLESRRENFLSYYGPLSLLVLLLIWAIGLILGFALLQWSFGSAMTSPLGGGINFGTDFYMSGTTLFTLGLGDVLPLTVLARVVTVAEAGTGLGFLALVIGYLPVIYQSFSRREVGISMMDAHAGSPPSALEMLRRHKRGDVMSEMIEHLHDWESWCGEILESHLSYPVLMYYRSQHDRQSWLAALTTILDATALLVVGIDGVSEKTAWFAFAIATHAAVDLGQVFANPTNLSIDRLPPADFARLQEQLTAMGIPLHDEDTAEERLLELRQRYEPYVIALSQRLHMPLPGWFAEKDNIDDWQTSRWRHESKPTAV